MTLANQTFSPFDRRETLAASIARLNRQEAIFFQEHAAEISALAVYARDTAEPAETVVIFQCASAYFANEARRSLARLIEGGR
jgi:hypothetical protein